MHKKIVSFIIIALSLILRPSACLGQTSTSASQWTVEKFDVENGLDHKSVRGFVFDKNGELPIINTQLTRVCHIRPNERYRAVF